MIFRIRKTDNYTVICNHVFRNNTLSWKAKGLLAEMLSMPDDWKFSIQELIKRAKDGRDAVYSAINELEKAGYLRREQATNEKGQFVGYDYNVYENPQAEKPHVENPHPEKPYTENPTLLSTDIVPSKEGTTQQDNTPIIIEEDSTSYIPPTVPQKEKRFRKPTLEEVKAYCEERRNSVDPQHFIDYYESNGWRVGRNPMKDWKAAVRTWERKENKPLNSLSYGDTRPSAGQKDTGGHREHNYNFSF